MERNEQSGAVTQTNAIAFQRSGTLILDTSQDVDGRVEDQLRQFAELSSAAGSLHTYQVTDLSLWSAASSGMTASDVTGALTRHASNRIPSVLVRRIDEYFGRFGAITLTGTPESLRLESGDPVLLQYVGELLDCRPAQGVIHLPSGSQGQILAKLGRAGYPVVDQVFEGTDESGGFQLCSDFALRDYQEQAVQRFVQGRDRGGVVLLPCGAGKTVVGVAAAAALDTRTLVVTPNRTVGEQWADHFQRLTTLSAGDVALFDGIDSSKPVNIVTYQALTGSTGDVTATLHEASSVPWGLIIYDEVHSLPADVFRQSAVLRTRRRLGLTATLVREDGRENEVFSLVGPPVWRSRWRDLERQGWISPVECFEIRVRSNRDVQTGERGLMAKIRTVERILARHPDDRTLIAAHRINHVRALATRLKVPAITGETSTRERSALYQAFRDGEIRTLVVSRVANVGVDLPDANVLIQVSGTFGSRLEEAQRVGRLLRPKEQQKPARFYSLVLPDSREREFAERRQRFLIEQGYRYEVVNTTA